MADSWWVYIIQTEKGHLYTGITTDVKRRWQEHCAVVSDMNNSKSTRNKGAKYFRSQAPKKMVYQQECASRSEASKQEAIIKKMSRRQKLQLCGLA